MNRLGLPGVVVGPWIIICHFVTYYFRLKFYNDTPMAFSPFLCQVMKLPKYGQGGALGLATYLRIGSNLEI